jgi:argininosuccinate synthase
VIAQKLVEVAGIEQTTVVAHGCGADDPRVASSVRALDGRITVIAVPNASNGGDPWMGPRIAFHGEPPSQPAYIEMTFTRGTPTAVNGITMPLLDLLGSIDMLAGAHRVGRLDHLETPAVSVLHAAHGGLQHEVSSGASERESVAREYVELIESGNWFSPDREALDAAVDRLEASVSGLVRIELGQGECRIVEIRAGIRG